MVINIIRGKKGLDKQTLAILGGIILMLIIVIIVGGLLNKASRFGLAGVKALENPTVESKEFQFYADKIVIKDDSYCSFNSATNKYTCRKNEYINFTTTIRNEYNQQLKLYGGFIVCSVTCNDKDQCTIANKKCFEDGIITSTKFCYLSIGESRDCDGGKKSFEAGEYFIYPLAKCDMDKTLGCWKDGMTKAVINSPNTYIRVVISNGGAGGSW